MRLVAVFLLSLSLGLAGLYLATREALFSAALYAPRHATPFLITVAVLSLVALWSAPVAKLVLLARSQGYRVGWSHAFLSHVAQVFGTAMTPAGTGGGPFLVVALERVGVPAGVGLAMAVQLFVLDLATLGILIPVGLAYILVASPIDLGAALTLAAAVAAAAALVISVILVRFPAPVVRLLHAISGWRLLRRFQRRLRRIAVEYRESAVVFRDLPVLAWALLHAVNFTAWLTNFALFWALLAMYGAHVRLLDVLALLSMITLLSFFVPTPGASGVMELMLGLAMGASDSRLTSVAAPVVLWRTGTFYLAFILGPLSAWRLLSRRAAPVRTGRKVPVSDGGGGEPRGQAR